MIKKEYFPTQEVPERVKARVMQKIYAKPKAFRLLSFVRYKVMVPALALLFVVTGGYVYLHLPRQTIIVTTNLSGATTIISTTTTVTTTTQVTTTGTSTDDLLQQKLVEAESALNDLSTYANQEEEITL